MLTSCNAFSLHCTAFHLSPSSQRAGIDSGFEVLQAVYPCRYSVIFLYGTPSVSVVVDDLRVSVSFNAAADLMAPALSAGMLVGVSTAPAEMPQP